MVATDAFGAGIDLPDIDWVVSVGFPAGIEAYYQQFGRAGRSGQHARGILLVDEDSTQVDDAIINAVGQADSFPVTCHAFPVPASVRPWSGAC